MAEPINYPYFLSIGYAINENVALPFPALSKKFT
uniref:Uncharacterized protein n=1 Tax=Podoviridae sp. ctG4L18 TaxID=2825234 RepID=A0A8S5UP77_9CAUD|nr:MAG TPA: hypothetical protein [Podoviridae sp. ctG4L18]